mmetsp:Transcript_13473/g.31685  ORF Transcript_13473/g.31685 Transcript_13473/m.31685 type:complete len:166 (+) Transcript_13473:82-579(+)|eukprot:CAMPEP_0178431414 /NCGR_PEP_ID=MMETSP0689_2-20121128/31833_1 /TAXON_ID=160604 /ORGANISM="Amphidinium massartii, Strain CS-259" /LENGTH=165 /DNA_ID=CAMNT_0020053321 /DNA_START=87 /DNA_END=584 /DNA_ORIENTATION=+
MGGVQCCKSSDKDMVNSESIAVNSAAQPSAFTKVENEAAAKEPTESSVAAPLSVVKEAAGGSPTKDKGGKTGTDAELDQFELHIVRNGRPAGLDAAYVASAQKLYVWSVKTDGLIAEWNEANPTKKVYRGCMVMEINGESVASMSDEDVRAAFLADDLTMLIQRG